MFDGRAMRFLAALVVLALVAPAPQIAPADAAPPAPVQPELPLLWEAPWARATPSPVPLPDRPQPTRFPSPSTWTAGESWVTRLSPAQQRALLGVPVEVIEAEHQQALAHLSSPEAATAVYSYPQRIDWRRFHGHNWTTSVKYQGICQACAAFATVATIESRVKLRDNSPEKNVDLSEAHLYFCPEHQCGVGWNLWDAMKSAKDPGVTTESCYPYLGHKDKGCSPCADWNSQTTRLEAYFEVYGPDAIKQAVAQGGPVAVDFLVYSDFYSYHGGVYRHTWGGVEGGHAVSIVGYDDCGGYWILKNSWGTGWGEKGYFRMAYNEAEVDDSADLPLLAAPANVACTPAYNQVAVYSEQNYQGRCKVLELGSYASPDDLQPVGDDSALSILIGSNATAILFPEVDFGGDGESFAYHDPELLDNVIGPATSSMKVTPRDFGLSTPDGVRMALYADDSYDNSCVYLPAIRR